MTTRRILRAALGSIAGLALAGGAVFVGTQAPPAVAPSALGATDAAPSVTVTPPPAEAVLAWAGPVVALGLDATDASGLSRIDDLRVTAGNAQGEEPERSDDLELDGVGSAAIVTQSPDGDSPVPVAAAGSVTLDDLAATGYAIASCGPGSPEAWIAGASGQTGVSDIVMIANPSDVPATVSLEVFGVDGRTVPAGADFAVAAHGQRAIPVAALAGDEQDPMLRVTSEGAPIRVTLQSITTSGLSQQGVDIEEATMPTTSAVVPRVRVTRGTAASGTAATTVQLMGTTGTPGQVDIDLVDEATGEVAAHTRVALTPEVPVAAAFDSLAEGSYAVRMSSKVPFVSAVRQSSGSDYAWYTPSEPLEGEQIVAVPQGNDGKIALSFAAYDDDVRIELTPTTGGDGASLDLDAGRSGTIVLDDEKVYRIEVAGGAVAGAAGTSDDGRIGSFAIEPDPAEPEPVVVSP